MGVYIGLHQGVGTVQLVWQAFAVKVDINELKNGGRDDISEESVGEEMGEGDRIQNDNVSELDDGRFFFSVRRATNFSNLSELMVHSNILFATFT